MLKQTFLPIFIWNMDFSHHRKKYPLYNQMDNPNSQLPNLATGMGHVSNNIVYNNHMSSRQLSTSTAPPLSSHSPNTDGSEDRLSDNEMLTHWSGAMSSTSPTEMSQGDGKAMMFLSKKERRKRRLKPPGLEIGELICGVCGDKAHGYNFNAITCESCKAFFRRNALRVEVIKCNFDGNCKLDPHTRRFCTECRLKKCFDIGMKKEWILNDDQLQKRREKSMMKKEKIVSSDSSDSSISSMNHVDMNHMQMQQNKISPKPESTVPAPPPPPPPHQITLEPVSYIPDDPSKCTPIPIVKTEPESPSTPLQESPTSSAQWDSKMDEVEIAIGKLEGLMASTVDAPYTETDCSKFCPSSASDMFNMADTFIRRFIKFCKSLPEFSCLSQPDQISLLKGGIMEVMVLRGALKFDPVHLSFKFTGDLSGFKGTGRINSALIYKTLGKPELSHLQYHGNAVHFFKSVNDLAQGDKTVILLLLLIELFSPDRMNLEDKSLVEKAQERYSYLLRMHLHSHFPVEDARSMYPKLLMKLVEVRELGDTSSKAAARVNVTDMEPLLVEVFSL